MGRFIQKAIASLLIFQLIGCGTIFYPERKGQKSGRLDAGVVILDALGLLLFLIPGIIAFAVDFSNGTIYLPGTGSIVKEIKFDPKTTSIAQIEQMVKDNTGRTVKLTQSNVQVSKLTSKNEMMVQLAQASKEIETARLASIK